MSGFVFEVMPGDDFIFTQPLVGQRPVGNQNARRSRRAALLAAGMKERKPTGDEEQRSGLRPDVILKGFGIRPGKNQREAIPVLGATLQPVAGFRPVRGITPNQSLPWSSQTVLFDGEMISGCFPWTLHWSAGIKVKRAKRTDDFRRGQPFLFAILQITVMCEIAEFRAATVGDDFLNEFFLHWKNVFDDDFR